jgi:peptidoglycan hydrolase CwlO-like protein
MADINEPVAIGALAVDCTALKAFHVDLPPGARRGLRAEQDGFGEVIAEILSNQAEIGDKAGITKNDIDDLALANARIAQIDARLPAVRKLLEILEETRAKLDDQRQRQVSSIARLVDVRAKALSDKTLLAKYEKTRTYRSAIALKGAKTRRKNAEAAKPEEPTVQ